MESDEEDIKPGFAGSSVSSRSPSPILDHFHPQSPQQQQHAAPNETQEQPCRPLIPRQRKKQANFDVAQGEDQVFVAGSTSTRRKGRAARADSDTDFDADNQDDDGLDDDEDEEEESDGESSEEETLDTAGRRQGRAKKQQAVKGMWSAESVLPEEEFGSKTVIEIYTMIKQGIINLNPDYQRGAVWPQPHSQGLIASLFQNMHVPHLLFNVYTPEPNEADEYYVPIPPSEQIDPRGVASVPKTVMDRGKGKGKGKERAEEGDGWISREVWSCADGKQRMTAIVRFIDGEFPAIAENKKKYLYSKLDPAAKQVFDNKRLQYGYFRELSDRQEREIFRRVQLGKALDKGEKLASIDAPYADWVRELQAQFFNSSDRNSMRPRILALGRGRALVAAYQASYNIRVCVQHDSLDAVKCQSDTARSKELSSNKVPNAQIKAIVQQILERFHRLTLIDPLEGEDEWPNTKAGKKMKAAGLKVPHRVWRLSTAEIGSGGTKGEGGKKATSSSHADSVIAFAPVEMYLLPALVWHMEKEFDYLGDGRLLEIIELARIFLHTKFRKVMKDNTGVTEAFKQWCNDFNADRITDKYRDDGTLRSQKRKKKRSRPDDDSASATPSVAPSTSTASTSKAKPADAASLAAAAAPLQSGSGKKKRPAATEAASTSSATKGKGKGKATSATTSTSEAANPRSDAFLPPPAAPPSPPSRSTPSASTTSNQISPGGAVMPFGSPSQKSKSSFPSASAAATVDANAGTVVIPSQPHTRGLNAPQPSQQAALSAKQAKFAGLVGNAGVPPPPPPTSHTGGPRQQPSIATSLAHSQAIRGLPSSKKRGREEPVKRDERGRPIVTPVAVGGENGYGPLSAGGQDTGVGLGGMSMGELGMMDYEALDADQRERERMERETQNALNGARNGGRAGGGGGGRYDDQHNQNLGTSVNGNEPDLKRVKREPGVEPSSSGGYAADDRDEDEAMRERREREKDEETFAILRQRNGGGGGRYSRENSRDRGGGRARCEDDRHAPPRRYEDDRYGLPPRGRYEDHGRGFGGGSGGRNDERYGRESNGDWDRDWRRRVSGESRSSSSLSRLPPNLQTVAGLPPRPTTSIGASNGYNDPDNAANASGQRGIPLEQQNALRPPTMDPRKRKN